MSAQQLVDPETRNGSSSLGYDSFQTTDPDEAVEQVTKILAPHEIELHGDLAQFRARVSRLKLKNTGLCRMQYQSPLSFHCAPQSMFVAVLVPLAGDMAISYRGGTALDVPAGCVAVVPSDCQVEIRHRTGFSMLIANAQASALSAGLRRVAPELSTSEFCFGGVVATDGATLATIHGLINLLTNITSRYSSPELIPGNLVDALAEQIVSTFVLALPHSASERMLRTTPISSPIVKHALKVIAADHYAQASISDIAAEVGVSMRSLELGFRKELDCTPHQYLQNFRLQKAHEQLRRAYSGDGTTVTDVSIRWGFNHTGRFAKLHRRNYGVCPSQVLRSL